MLHCPECNSPEILPHKDGKWFDSESKPHKLLIRGCKVYDEDNNAWSHCMVCSGNYDKDYNWLNLPLNRDEGWFLTSIHISNIWQAPEE